MLQVFKSRRMAAVMVLGFSSGLPFYLTSRTLQAWMTVAGVNLTAIGFISLLALPYSLKFLWSPLIDRFSFPFLGRRKGWLMVTQLALTVAIGTMAFQDPADALNLLAINAFAIAFLSATQDIIVDAYSVDILDRHEVGAGAGIKVLGYRIAMVLTGAVALILADLISWPAVYGLMAGLMFVMVILSVRAPEPKLFEPAPAHLKEAVRMPFLEFFQRAGTGRGVLILVFLVIYRLGDSMIGNMTTSFLLQTGFTQTDIGAIQGGVGLFASIVGILIGGAVLSQIGINRSLWVFGGLQAGSNFAYLLLANNGRNYPLMVVTIVIENVCYGLATAALVGFLMSLCDPRFSATQYALLSSVMSAGRDVLASPAGSIADITGWPLFFLITIFAALPALAMLPLVAPWGNSGTVSNF